MEYEKYMSSMSEEEKYKLAGILFENHIEPSLITKDFEQIKMSWLKSKDDTTHHRENGPAFLSYSRFNGKLNSFSWLLDDKLHRIDGPAWVEWDYDGRIQNMTWNKDGQIHRDDGPAQIDIKNPFIVEIWRKDGVIHRTDGPAYVEYYMSDNEIKNVLSRWLYNGRHHRIEGPAIYGEAIKSRNFIFGNEISESNMEVFNWIKENDLLKPIEEWSVEDQVYFKILWSKNIENLNDGW